jgi:hypothetical protein
VHEQPQRRQACASGLELHAALLVELLAQAAAGGVARVRERREAAGGAAGELLLVAAAFAPVRDHTLAQSRLEGVEVVEGRDGDVDLAAHLDDRWMPLTGEACRDARDLERIDGDVLAHAAVAAGGG